jgi:precorrin-6Y C5,15-methyltransferase (decarboxylating)
MSEILIFGVSGDQLPADCLHSLQTCYAVVVSKRFEPLLAASSVRRISIAPVKIMVAAVAEALDRGDVAILASGDPLFFGIGRTMIDRFGAERVRIFPALSALQ